MEVLIFVGLFISPFFGEIFNDNGILARQKTGPWVIHFPRVGKEHGSSHGLSPKKWPSCWAMG